MLLNNSKYENTPPQLYVFYVYVLTRVRTVCIKSAHAAARVLLAEIALIYGLDLTAHSI
jgi:hypothetical protein